MKDKVVYHGAKHDSFLESERERLIDKCKKNERMCYVGNFHTAQVMYNPVTSLLVNVQ